jgi:hypothetical protein
MNVSVSRGFKDVHASQPTRSLQPLEKNNLIQIYEWNEMKPQIYNINIET